MLSTVFFDAGNTLVFADHARTLRPLAEAGFTALPDQLNAAERFAKKRLDSLMATRQPGQSVDRDYWSTYYTHLTDALGAPAVVIDACVTATRRSDHWTRVRPGTRQVLDRLKARGLRLGVIANSDGHIADLLRAVGMGDCFETFTDSGTVGAEKPDAAIFRQALASLDARAESSVFIGDIYSVDYLGAQGVGMSAVLMDSAAVYAGDPYRRVASLEELEALL